MTRALLLSLWLAVAASAQEVVRFPGADGFELEARLVASSDGEAPVAICLHQYRSDKDSWKPLLPALQDAGFTALALDQRGHGGSTKKGGETAKVADVPREKFGELLKRGPEDVKAALAFLRSKGYAAKKVVLFGASYGCSVSLLAAAELPEVEALVLLSPGEDYFGVDVRPAWLAFKGPILLLTLRGDQLFETSIALARKSPQKPAGPRFVGEYAGPGHGTSLLATPPPKLELLEALPEAEPLVAKLTPLEDPRRLVVAWLAEAAKLGTVSRGPQR